MITTNYRMRHMPTLSEMSEYPDIDIGLESNQVLPEELSADIYKEPELRDHELDWFIRRKPILQLAKIIQQSNRHKKEANRLLQCGKLHFGYESKGQLKFVNASHCRFRPCPECQRDRQRQHNNKFRHWIGSFLQQYPHLVFIYLTVGYQNVPITQVPQINKRLHEGFARLFRKANTKLTIEGSATFFHFTIRSDAQIHFDTHSIIVFDPSVYGADEYHKKAFWADLIEKRFKLDYQPNIDVQKIGFNNEGLKNELIKAFSYGARPLNYLAEGVIENSELLTLQLIDELALSHSIISTGSFRTFPKTVPKATTEKPVPVLELWMKEKMIVNDLRKKPN